MANKNDNTKTRMEAFDVAAHKFEEYLNYHKITYQNFGISKKIKNSGKMPRFGRNAPDYIVSNRFVSFFEVKGCRNELWLKIKDLDEYKRWNEIMNLRYFFYSTTYKKAKFINHVTLINLLATAPIKQLNDPNMHDDKKCYVLQWKDIRRSNEV